MKILFISSEVVPFAKTGGLADVAAALPQALARMGHDARIMMPLYRSVDRYKHRLLPLLREMVVQWGNERLVGEIMRCSYPCDEEVPVYFLQQDMLYDRPGIYNDQGHDYDDNDRRFGFMCLAALWTLKAFDWQPDIIHLNDWPTGIVAPLLKFHPVISNDPFYRAIRTVYTIHNLAYQGLFSSDILAKAQLPWSIFDPGGVEYHGAFSSMKAGLVYADRLTTVSPTYAREIQTPEFGVGLDGLLRSRASTLHGILNGIDDRVWNPATDKLLPANYSVDDMAGKAVCKRELLAKYGIPASDAPIIGMVSRLVGQKGFRLVREAMPFILSQGFRFVLVGTGEREYEDYFRALAAEHPQQAGAAIDYREDLAHLVEAGADFFLMPSLFEPSGLNQLYSMAYGTIPVVRNVGGLSDSVEHATLDTLRAGRGTGILFNDYTPQAVVGALAHARNLYNAGPQVWSRLVRNAMSQDFSWTTAARHYEDVYRALMPGA